VVAAWARGCCSTRAPRKRPTLGRGVAGLRLQPARRQPADHVGQVRGGRQEPAHRAHQRLARE
jgi:hypothetical protein